jgi:uncharacterized membrane protein YedE/YeeE
MFLALIGGLLIGLAAGLLWFLNGRILGVSGIIGGLFTFSRADTLWRATFLGGLLSGGVLMYYFNPQSFEMIQMPSAALVIAGFLVGFGTRLGNGCTSGHGVCGISRISMRSILATLLFMGVGILTVSFVRHVLGGL